MVRHFKLPVLVGNNMVRYFLTLGLFFTLAMAPQRCRAAEVMVLIHEYYFTPTNVTISPGDTVTWVNKGFVPHDSTSFTGLWASPGLFTEESFSFTFTDPGSYPYVCLRHVFAFPQQTGLVVVASMNLPPSVSITNPVNGAFFPPPASFTINANASDSDGSVARVEFFVNGASAGVSLGPVFATNVTGLGAGNYRLTAVATDNQGATNISSPVNIFVQESPPTNFTLTVNVTPPNAGIVRITPPSTNGTYLAGSTVALAAQANSGFRFTNWSGDVSSTDNPLLLVMTGDLSVTAEFVPRTSLDFRELAGTYSGLLSDQTTTNYTLSHYTASGPISLRLSKTGAYRGTVAVGGTRQFVAGQFDRFGYAPLVARRSTLSGSVQIDDTGLRMLGSLTDGQQAPMFLLYRAVTTTNLAAPAGDYSLRLAAMDPVEQEGLVMLQVLENGKVQMRGRLGDGTEFSTRTFLSPDGSIPWFKSLYSLRGGILSWLYVGSDGTVHGTARWFRPGNSRNVNYPDGFGLVIPVTGSRE